MPLQVDWNGVFPAVPTQFNDDFSINIDATRQHVEALMAEGIHGFPEDKKMAKMLLTKSLSDQSYLKHMSHTSKREAKEQLNKLKH